MPRPYVAAIRWFGSSGSSMSEEIGTFGRPVPSTLTVEGAGLLPLGLPGVIAKTPMSVPTRSCCPRRMTHVAGVFGSAPEMSVNV
jgi:hypothetical protein